MRPLRFLLGAAGFVAAPAFLAGAVTFTVIDRIAARLARTHPTLEAGIAAEAASWLAVVNDMAPTFPVEGDPA